MMMQKESFNIGNIRVRYEYIAIFLFIAAILSTMLISGVTNDFGAHRYILANCLKIGSFPVPPLYYVFLYIFSFGLASGKTIFLAIVFLMSSFITFKYIVTKNFVNTTVFCETNNKEISKAENWRINEILTYISFCLIIITPISFGTHLYLGKIGINIWHNSTIIAEFPVAILLFIVSKKYLIDKNNVFFPLILLLICFDILFKPSYFLAFFVAFPLMNLITDFRISKRFKIDYRVLGCVLFGLALLFLEYYLIYAKNIRDATAIFDKTTIKIVPFYVWNLFSNNIPFDLLMSIMYPIIFLISYFKEVKTNTGYHYAWLTFVVGLLIAILLVEAGPRDNNANFFWTSITTNYILFAYSISLNLRFLISRGRFLVKDYILSLVFGAHVISGIYYIISLYISKNY